MANGYRNKDIAQAFGVSEGTVKNHVSSILSKLSIRDRIRAVLKGIRSAVFSNAIQRSVGRSLPSSRKSPPEVLKFLDALTHGRLGQSNSFT